MTITALFGTLLAIELVGDICYRVFYRMVGRNKYRVGDIVWIRVNDVLEFAQAIIELIQWRDDTKLRRKAMAIQRVIDRKVMWAHEHGMKLSLYMCCTENGYDLYGKNWGRKWGK